MEIAAAATQSTTIVASTTAVMASSRFLVFLSRTITAAESSTMTVGERRQTHGGGEMTAGE